MDNCCKNWNPIPTNEPWMLTNISERINPFPTKRINIFPFNAPAQNHYPGGMHKCIPYESSRQIPIYQDAAAFGQRNKPRRLARLFYMLALPIFPASHPASIVGADELNFCVRDGNRWTLIAINTNFFGWV